MKDISKRHFDIIRQVYPKLADILNEDGDYDEYLCAEETPESSESWISLSYTPSGYVPCGGHECLVAVLVGLSLLVLGLCVAACFG